MDEGGQFSFYKDSEGRWWRTQRTWRCCEEVLFQGQCQGPLNHAGVHWAFRSNGDFCWHDSDSGYSGQTPPGHERYRDPVEMREFYHACNHLDPFLIEDPDEIARLDAGDLDDGECTIRAVEDL